MNLQDYHISVLTREQAINIYRNITPAHFPADELKPVAAIEALYDRDAYWALGLFANNDKHENEEMLLGYALFLKVPGLDTVLLDYYAILEQYRNLGMGHTEQISPVPYSVYPFRFHLCPQAEELI